MSEFKFREATVNDIDFIIKAIIEAEKSGSDKLSYSTIFNLTETEVKTIFRSMLEEEVDGCEFSLTSYIIAEKNNEIAGTIGAWIENSDYPSSFIKSNLLSSFLPKSSLVYASNEAKIVSDLIVEHVESSLAIAIVYISLPYRGQQLFKLLVDEHIKRNMGIKVLTIQVMSNNYFAIKTYKRYGFIEYDEIVSQNEMINRFLPYNKKLLMKMSI